MEVAWDMETPPGKKYAEDDDITWYVFVDLHGRGIERVPVPKDKVNMETAPSGRAYVFILAGTIQCFVRPQIME